MKYTGKETSRADDKAKALQAFYRKILIVGCALLSIFILHGFAGACSCDADETVEKEFAKTPNVAVLKLRSVVRAEGAPENYVLSVEKVFKGDLKVDELLNFMPGIVCSWTFSGDQIGTEFLFYLGKRPTGKFWIAGFCTRSGDAKNRTADLLYLENEAKLRGKTRLSGNLSKITENLTGTDRYSFVSLANKKLRITGKGKDIELTTDENGFYEIYDLPAGKYKITPEKIDGFVFSSERETFREVGITAQSHTEQNFYFEIDNAVSGKLVDKNGKPLESVCVDLVLSGRNGAADSSKASCTNKKGEFNITAIPTGTYRLVVNKDGKISLREPFPTFYYPNVKNIEEASEISVEANSFLKDLTLVPPEMIETITLSGTLTYADGKPAADEKVQLLRGDQMTDSSEYISPDFEVETDENGSFAIKILKGQPGVLRGTTYSYIGKFLNCPVLDEIVKRKGGKVQKITTNDVEIDATGNLGGIELKLPFPGCKKAKI